MNAEFFRIDLNVEKHAKQELAKRKMHTEMNIEMHIKLNTRLNTKLNTKLNMKQMKLQMKLQMKTRTQRNEFEKKIMNENENDDWESIFLSFFLVSEIKFFLTLRERILKSTLNISLSRVLFQHTK